MNHRTFSQHPTSSGMISANNNSNDNIMIVGSSSRQGMSTSARRDINAGSRIVHQRSSPSTGYISSARPHHLTDVRSSTTSTAGKVAEVFLTASHAFQKLGDLILPLHTPISESTDNNKWSDRDVDRLKEALSRFAQELDGISDSVQARTIKHIKTDIKRYSTIGQSDMRTPLNYTNLLGSGGNNMTSSSIHTQSVESSQNDPELETMAYSESSQMDSSLSQQQQQYTSSPPRLEHAGLGSHQPQLRTRVVHLATGGQQGQIGGNTGFRTGNTIIKRQAPSYMGSGMGGSVMYRGGSGPPPLKKPMSMVEAHGSGMVSSRQNSIGQQQQQPSTTFRPVRNEAQPNLGTSLAAPTPRITRSSEAAAAAARL